MMIQYALFALLLLIAAAASHAVDKPNIVFFMADDLGWNNVGWHNKDMITPNANALVKDGIELDQHRSFLYCSPSRSSLMSGRLPYHVQQVNRQNCDLGQGVHSNFTFISERLKADAGYQTLFAGKWHLGMPSWKQIPHGRGFDRSLVFFEGAEDHWTQRSCTDPMCLIPVNASSRSPYDFWEDTGPAKDKAGTRYNGYQFNDFVMSEIDAHDPDKGPMFMYLAPANSHTPLEVPGRFLDMYPESYYIDRRQYAGMCSFWDEMLGNVTDALKAKGMWENTLLVFSADNGGPAYWSVEASFPHGAGANNWPLKGSKASNWEGGTRVAAFVSGGFVPKAKRGTKLSSYIHLADWYATFAAIAGIDPTDHRAAAAGLPPIDSMNMWPLLTGVSGATERTEVPLAVDSVLKSNGNTSALIQGRWKIMVGNQVLSYWQGPEFPNASSAPYGVITDPSLMQNCTPACLYDLENDPNETSDVAAENSAIVQKMLERLDELKASRYDAEANSHREELRCLLKVKENGGFFGPWLDAP